MGSIIPYLFGITFFLVIVFAIYQYFRTKKAKQTKEHSAMTDGPARTG